VSISLVVVLGVLAFVGALTMARRGRRAHGDGTWVRSDGPAPAAAAERKGVFASLVRVEARQLLASPAFLAGLGLSALILIVFGGSPAQLDKSWWLQFNLLPMIVHPLVGCTVIAAHFAMTRARRSGSEELFESCPLDQATRTGGHLATAWVAAVAALVFVGVFLALAVRGNEGLYGGAGPGSVWYVLTTAVLAAGGVALGAALGRWAPWPLVPFAAIGAVLALDGLIGSGTRWTTRWFLATFMPSPSVDLLFLEPRPAARLFWLASLGVVVAGLGLARDRRPLGLRVAAAAGVVALVSAIVVARPIANGRAVEITSALMEPAAHQRCVPAGGGVDVCAYRQYGDHAVNIAAALRPIVGALPAGVVNGVRFMQYSTGPVDALPPEVAAVLKGDAPLDPEGVIHLRFSSLPENYDATRLRLAARAVGLPTEPARSQLPMVVAGQARGVVVLWLAGRGMGSKGIRMADRHWYGNDPRREGMVWPGACSGESGALTWSRQDLEAARRLFRADERVVGERIRAGWSRYTDAATTTDQLLADLGIGPVGPYDAVYAQAYGC
jgi:hypothetical protein